MCVKWCIPLSWLLPDMIAVRMGWGDSAGRLRIKEGRRERQSREVLYIPGCQWCGNVGLGGGPGCPALRESRLGSYTALCTPRPVKDVTLRACGRGGSALYLLQRVLDRDRERSVSPDSEALAGIALRPRIGRRSNDRNG
ncbi:hypothetical protein CALVIDRAFT_428319 [Calocera viscosa TUFC12733]|uniref:Uncharacterized protein n=1 Tax=Calocera viscosa (strain TUFC12733) TaxID=1330018 RepID=A0A167PMD7_CALVF|nr:hypothetical protein CALVIDRAFT_428319 [Calocera viscosa TUFC12733]